MILRLVAAIGFLERVFVGRRDRSDQSRCVGVFVCFCVSVSVLVSVPYAFKPLGALLGGLTRPPRIVP